MYPLCSGFTNEKPEDFLEKITSSPTRLWDSIVFLVTLTGRSAEAYADMVAVQLVRDLKGEYSDGVTCDSNDRLLETEDANSDRMYIYALICWQKHES